MMLTNPDNQKLFQCMLRTMENMSQSFLYFDKQENTLFFANKQAILCFADKEGVIDIQGIFHNEEMPAILTETITEQLKIADYVMLHDVQVTDNKGKTQLCEVQVGYSDDEQNIIFIEIFCN